MPRTDSELNLEDPKEYSLNTPLHVALFGTNGSGKTTFAAKTSADAELKVVVLDCGDAGAVTLRKVNPKFLKIQRISGTKQFLEIMEKINSMSKEIDIVVVDTLTGLQGKAIKEVKGRLADMNQRKWGQVSSRIIECISEAHLFPKELIYLVQEKTKSGGDDSEDKTGPGLTPSIKGYLSSCVDWVGRLSVREDPKNDGVIQRVLDFRITDALEVKDRAGLFPKLIANPTYPAIRKRIISSFEGEESGKGSEVNNGK